MKKESIHITKRSGEKQTFDVEKLRRSLARSGAADHVVADILDQVTSDLSADTTSKQIHKQAFNTLYERDQPSAARYKLKKAIGELGPDGFAFEKFVERILHSEGFSTKTGQFYEGKCIRHEVDILATDTQGKHLIECKFHALSDRFCDVKVPLYIHARFNDIRNGKTFRESDELNYWIFNNTRFSKDAMAYALCANIHLVGWGYPDKGNLQQRVDEADLHPITSMSSITIHEKKLLIENNIIICKELCNAPNILRKIGISRQRKANILKEALAICHFN